ncbi:uncharacterized protein EV422DRAFT_542237 [Fimicolochytrium jonesii]|uniref:uncharacterized protein n=1 Tax=Fimicolochytrium jonesii TaxID=1396493 RepID=UPI0022FDE222|nr:uncharacterized protein EV422DRAFT_542237 [Fimicolochytrium jonesii]KAI8817277.1 hypothetical protein EV422DRAFT_542237 [Fimicolochytrium jonesii]
MESIRKLMEIANCLVPVGGLRAAAVKLTAKEREAEREIAGAEEGGWKGVRELREAILQTVHEADKVVSSYVEAQGKLIIKTADGFRLEAIGPDNGLRSTTGTIADTTTAEGDPSYGSYKLEYVDEDAGYYRRHFLGNEHRNYIGDMPKLGPVIISLMYKPGSQKADVPYSQSPPAVVGGSMGGGQGGEKDQGAEFWAIMRTKDAQPLRAVIDAARVTASSVLRQNPKHDVKAALQMLHRDIQPGKLRKVAGEGFERRLVALDELLTVTRYKFGVLYCKAGQTTEEEFFGNETGSPAFDRFLTRIGDKIDLSTWTGYSAGLDTKHGQTGKWSLYTKWRHFEVMYHVSTFLPYKKEDRQQIQRKRHIGNDIVAIIFIDGDTPFDPKSIKSQFLHIFIAVQEDRHTRPGKIGYRVVLASNVDVPPYGPPLPTPPVFWDEAEMRDFLLGKSEFNGVVTVVPGDREGGGGNSTAPFFVNDSDKRRKRLVQSAQIPKTAPPHPQRDDGRDPARLRHGLLVQRHRVQIQQTRDRERERRPEQRRGESRRASSVHGLDVRAADAVGREPGGAAGGTTAAAQGERVYVPGRRAGETRERAGSYHRRRWEYPQAGGGGPCGDREGEERWE